MAVLHQVRQAGCRHTVALVWDDGHGACASYVPPWWTTQLKDTHSPRFRHGHLAVDV
jgi:hypothetical protein